jgi:hypothetical protein
MSVAHHKCPPGERIDDRDENLARIAAALEKLVRIVDSGIGAYLNARFSGKGDDRWARR